MENSEIKDRIFKILTNENISSAKFADMIGVQRSNISHILSGRNNPGLDFLQKVLVKFPSINPEWLIIGKGEMFKQKLQTEIIFENTSPPTPEPVKNFSSVSSFEQQITPMPVKQKKIRQVLVLYDDDSFDILNPEKSES